MTGMDRETFAAIYRDNVSRVTGFAARRLFNPGEVADLVAATFLVALERSDSYDPEKGDPSAWLLGIAANLLANQRRRQVREELARARLDARALLSPDDVEALVTQMDASAEATRVRAAMDSLAEPYREVLLLIGESSLSSGYRGESGRHQPHGVPSAPVAGPSGSAPGHGVRGRHVHRGRGRHHDKGGPSMTPITSSFEDRLLDALLDRFDTMAHQPAAPPASSPRRAGIRRGIVVVGCLGAAVSLIVVLEPGGSAPATHVGSTSDRAQSATSAYALAAWTAQPTPAGQTQIAAAENNCAASFGQAAASQPAPGQKVGPPEAGGPWSPDLVDTRGDLTLTLYSDATQTMACLDSPSFVSIITVSGTGAPAVADNSATLDYLRIREASGDAYTVAMGRSGSAVSGVGLQRVDGSVRGRHGRRRPFRRLVARS